jgi:hypothetical protein
VDDAAQEPCQHKELQFNSGDYYITCHACGFRWARIHHSQPEYGHDKDGKPIGCTPERANVGFCDPDQFRRKSK